MHDTKCWIRLDSLLGENASVGNVAVTKKYICELKIPYNNWIYVIIYVINIILFFVRM